MPQISSRASPTLLNTSHRFSRTYSMSSRGTSNQRGSGSLLD
jgi:hypothetical protein